MSKINTNSKKLLCKILVKINNFDGYSSVKIYI